MVVSRDTPARIIENVVVSLTIVLNAGTGELFGIYRRNVRAISERNFENRFAIGRMIARISPVALKIELATDNNIRNRWILTRKNNRSFTYTIISRLNVNESSSSRSFYYRRYLAGPS